MISEAPIAIISAIAFSSIIYWVVGFNPGLVQFIYFTLVVVRGYNTILDNDVVSKHTSVCTIPYKRSFGSCNSCKRAKFDIGNCTCSASAVSSHDIWWVFSETKYAFTLRFIWLEYSDNV